MVAVALRRPPYNPCSLDYTVIPIMDGAYIIAAIPRFVDAAGWTLALAAWGIGLSVLFGLLVALVTTYRLPFLYAPARAYIELSRNTPLLIQLFFLYFGLPKVGIHWDGFVCGVIALTFLGSSYMAEALRAGLQAVARGQSEAARALGLSPWQILRYVVLPQGFAIALPALTANALFLLKETSVVSAVAVAEIMFVTKDIIGTEYMTNEALFLMFAAYLVLLLPLSLLAAWGEKRLRRAAYGT